MGWWSKEWLCVLELHAVIQDHLELGVLRVEVVGQTVGIELGPVLGEGEVVEETVASGLGRGGGHLALLQKPLHALDGEVAHALCCPGRTVGRSLHDDVHARHATHGAHVDHVLLHALTVAKPGGHQVLESGSGDRLLIHYSIIGH